MYNAPFMENLLSHKCKKQKSTNWGGEKEPKGDQLAWNRVQQHLREILPNAHYRWDDGCTCRDDSNECEKPVVVEEAIAVFSTFRLGTAEGMRDSVPSMESRQVQKWQLEMK